jgi:hypothetical protein
LRHDNLAPFTIHAARRQVNIQRANITELTKWCLCQRDRIIMKPVYERTATFVSRKLPTREQPIPCQSASERRCQKSSLIDDNVDCKQSCFRRRIACRIPKSTARFALSFSNGSLRQDTRAGLQEPWPPRHVTAAPSCEVPPAEPQKISPPNKRRPLPPPGRCATRSVWRHTIPSTAKPGHPLATIDAADTKCRAGLF